MQLIEVTTSNFATLRLNDSLLPGLIRIGDHYFGYSSRCDDYARVFFYTFYQTEKGKRIIDPRVKTFQDAYGDQISIECDKKKKEYFIARDPLSGEQPTFVSLGLSDNYIKFSSERYVRKKPIAEFIRMILSLREETGFDFSLFVYVPGEKGASAEEYSNAYSNLLKDVSIENAKVAAEQIQDICLSSQEKAVIKASDEFDKHRFLTDVSMTQEEVDSLVSFLPNLLMSHSGKEEKAFTVGSAFLAGKVYVGRDSFWSEFGRCLGLRTCPAKTQEALYRKFIKPFRSSEIHKNDYDRKSLGFIQHMMLFVFVADCFASNLFRLMNSFYKNDLKVDLGNLDDEMMDFFLDGVEDAVFQDWESSGSIFDWNIRKHTARAVQMDRESAKERFTRLFGILDKAYYGEAPELLHSTRRIERLLGQWLNRERPSPAPGQARGGSPKSKRPYLFFNLNTSQLQIVFPRVYYRYQVAALPEATWKLECLGEERRFPANPCMDGEFPIPYLEEQIEAIEPEWAFHKVFVCLEGFPRDVSSYLLGGEILFFNEKGDSVLPNNGSIPTGSYYLITEPGKSPTLSKESIVASWQKPGFDVYHVTMKEGAVLITQNGVGYRAGKPLEEGLCAAREYDDLQIDFEGIKANFWASVPMLLLDIRREVEDRYQYRIERNGLLLKEGKLPDLPHQPFGQSGEESQAIFQGGIYDLSGVASSDGVYRVLITTPGNLKPKVYSFAILNDLMFEFQFAPYYLISPALLAISKNTEIVEDDEIECRENGDWKIIAIPLDAKESEKPSYLNKGIAEIPIVSGGDEYKALFKIPCLYWRFSPTDEWQCSPIKDFTKNTLPDRFYIKSPVPLTGNEKITTSEYFGSSLDEGIRIEGITSNSQEGSFPVSRIKKEIRGDEPIQFRLEASGRRVDLFQVFPKAILKGGSLFAKKGGTLSGVLNILGDDTFVVSIFQNDIALEENISVIGLRFESEGTFSNGIYDVKVYTKNDDGFFFQPEYLGEFRASVTNLFSLSKERIRIDSFQIRNDNYGASFRLERKTFLTDFSLVDPDDFDIIGIYRDIDLAECIAYSCLIREREKDREGLFVLPFSETLDEAIVLVKNEDDEYEELLYDKKTKSLIESESGKDSTYKRAYIRSIDDETYLTKLVMEDEK